MAAASFLRPSSRSIVALMRAYVYLSARAVWAPHFHPHKLMLRRVAIRPRSPSLSLRRGSGRARRRLINFNFDPRRLEARQRG